MPTRFGYDALRNQIPYAPGQVILHFAPPLPVACVQKFLAVSGRASKVRLETAYPRFAKNWANVSYPHLSLAHGPPCGSTINGNTFASMPFGSC